MENQDWALRFVLWLIAAYAGGLAGLTGSRFWVVAAGLIALIAILWGLRRADAGEPRSRRRSPAAEPKGQDEQAFPAQ